MKTENDCRIAFITTGCVTFRTRLFELLENDYKADFFFYGTKRTFCCDTGSLKRLQYITLRFRTFLYFLKYGVLIKCINDVAFTLSLILFAKMFRKKIIIWSGSWYTANSIRGNIKRLLYMIMYRFSDGIVVYGDHVKRFIIGIDKYSETKIFTAYQVVENARFNSVISAQIKNDIRKELLIRNEQPIILCVCRIEKEKGVFDIIAAFKKLKNDDAVLLFIGNGSQNKSFEIEISQPQFSRVKWIKQIENSKLVQYYSIASVLCLFSKTGKTWKEPWGIVINEAMNQGLPCIASDAVGAAVGGLIKNGRNGLIVPEGDVDSLVIALESIVNNSERQCEMSLNAREDIAEWTYDMMAKGFVNAINYVRQKNS